MSSIYWQRRRALEAVPCHHLVLEVPRLQKSSAGSEVRYYLQRGKVSIDIFIQSTDDKEEAHYGASTAPPFWIFAYTNGQLGL